MPTVNEMTRRWTDAHFNYDSEWDCYSERKNIVRADGTVLYDVSETKEGAHYTVHFCAEAEEIWVVKVDGLRELIWFTREWEISYSPAKIDERQVTARGYLVDCARVLEFGHWFKMPKKLVARFLKAKTKSDVGKVAEKAFQWLVNDRHFFPEILLAPATRSSQRDDACGGIDFWCAGDVPVQVKFDGRGGTSKSGKLFFQTHTLPLRQCTDWNGYDYEK